MSASDSSTRFYEKALDPFSASSVGSYAARKDLVSTPLAMALLSGLGLVLVLLFAGCDPVWGAHVTLRGPNNVPVSQAMVTVACPGGDGEYTWQGWVSHTDLEGKAFVGSIGSQWPSDCDLYVAAPGLPVRRIRYADLCPGGSDNCYRMVDLDLALTDERQRVQ